MNYQFVEDLINAIKLPKAARVSFSGHANLMERSTQFSDKRGGTSLSTIALADTPGRDELASGILASYYQSKVK